MRVVHVPVETDINKLHVKSSEVDVNDVTLTKNIRDALMAVFNELEGKAQGLSAIQCGLPYCAILLRYVKGEEPIIAYNPKVLVKLGSKKSNEGCLSEGNKRYIVRRPIIIKVEYVTRYKERIIEWLPYKKARIFMHEYDHLQGVLLQDKGTIVEE